MRIQLKIDPALGVKRGTKTATTPETTEIPDNLCLKDLAEHLNISAEMGRYMLFFVNHRLEKGEYSLKEGDDVQLIAPVTGG